MSSLQSQSFSYGHYHVFIVRQAPWKLGVRLPLTRVGLKVGRLARWKFGKRQLSSCHSNSPIITVVVGWFDLTEVGLMSSPDRPSEFVNSVVSVSSTPHHMRQSSIVCGICIFRGPCFRLSIVFLMAKAHDVASLLYPRGRGLIQRRRPCLLD
jgi:hypothetical protein